MAFMMPWLLTWFTHEMNDPDKIGRAFDFFLCSHPIAPLYVSTAVILFAKCKGFAKQEKRDFSS